MSEEKRFERAIGEHFTHDGREYVVVDDAQRNEQNKTNCSGCDFPCRHPDLENAGECCAEKRKDGKDVHFVMVKNNTAKAEDEELWVAVYDHRLKGKVIKGPFKTLEAAEKYKISGWCWSNKRIFKLS